MREVKFRGLTDTEAPTWVYGSLVNNFSVYSEHSKYQKGTPVCEIIVPNGADCWEDIESYEGVVTVIPNSVGQFAGLKDKNGTEIYEGDIVRAILEYPDLGEGFNPEVKLIDEIGFVAFKDCCFNVETEDKEYGGGIVSRYDSIEVLGNIYQHPELIVKIGGVK